MKEVWIIIAVEVNLPYTPYDTSSTKYCKETIVGIELKLIIYRLFVADEVTFTITVIILPIPPLVYLSLL